MSFAPAAEHNTIPTGLENPDAGALLIFWCDLCLFSV
jgi:hypothetical protein